MDARGRGRARGRARGGQQGGPGAPGGGGPGGPRPGPPQGQQAWGARPGAPSGAPPQAAQPPQARPGPQGAWGRPPQQQPQQPPAQPQQWARAPAPSAVSQAVGGRGSRQGGGDEGSVLAASQPVVQGGGDAGLTERRGGGNGGVRGRTNRNEIITTRPQHIETKKGTDGTLIRLKANYFMLNQAAQWGLNQYRVDFNPDIDDTRTRRNLMRTGIKDMLTGYLFDGTVLYTPHRLNPEPLELFVEKEDSGERIRITIRLVGEVTMGDWHYIQLFNIVIRKCLYYLKLSLLGRNYFDPNSKIPIPEHNLELWPGYFTSMGQYEKNIMLNCDLQFKVLRTDTVYDLMLECRSRNVRQEFQQRVIGSIVLTSYNNKTYRIDDVDFNTTPASLFSRRDGSQISYIQYYRERYNLNITVQDQPMLVSKSKPREIRAGMPEIVYLVPELCTMTGLTDRQRENFQLMKALANYTRIGPQGRIQKLLDFSRRLQGCAEAMAEIKRWDLKLANDLVELEGRVMPQEMLESRNGQRYPAGDQADWTRNIRSAPLFCPAPLETLAVICPVKFKEACNEFMTCLIKAARGMQWNIPNWKIFPISDDRSHTYLDALENIISRDNPRMVMCVLSNNSSDRYNAIKKKCCVDRAIPSQVILAKNLSSKGVMSIATKVAIQLCCKVGGAPWGTGMPKNIMVVGYDVCRDTANRGKSFGGMVASLDAGCTRYFNHAVEHEHEQELSSNIASFMLMACQKYKEINKIIPERIVVFRDGVGDGQIPYVKEHEVEQIKKKLTEDLYKNQPLKMAFIIVSKRINTRIFRGQASGPQPDFNPPPGTVVDDIITLPYRYDFFIVSQCVRQGTVTPTSYNVIEDTLGIDANKLQRFTYKMTHMYFNWSGTVRVPAPCQYAHKLSFLTAQSLHRTAHRGLDSLLFYL